MTFPFRWLTSHFKADAPSKHDTTKAKAKAIADEWAACKRAVYQRDGYRCRCCGAAVDTRSTSLLTAPHPHHIVYRSKGRNDSTSNVVLLCAGCHDLVHVKKSLSVEGDADKQLLFWAREDSGRWYLLKPEANRKRR